RARLFFEARYHWERVVAPVMDRIRAVRRRVSRGKDSIDLTWMSGSARSRLRRGTAAVLPPSVFGEQPEEANSLNVVSAEHGAYVAMSSSFHPRPNDADYLLRSPTPGGYAAGHEAT